MPLPYVSRKARVRATRGCVLLSNCIALFFSPSALAGGVAEGLSDDGLPRLAPSKLDARSWCLLRSGLDVFAPAESPKPVEMRRGPRDWPGPHVLPALGETSGVASCASCESQLWQSPRAVLASFLHGIGALVIATSIFLPSRRPSALGSLSVAAHISPENFGTSSPGLTVVGWF